MMYPFLTLDDQTEIVHSQLLDDGSVQVYVEKPDEKDCSLLLLRGRKPLPPEHHRRYPVGDGRSD